MDNQTIESNSKAPKPSASEPSSNNITGGGDILSAAVAMCGIEEEIPTQESDQSRASSSSVLPAVTILPQNTPVSTTKTCSSGFVPNSSVSNSSNSNKLRTSTITTEARKDTYSSRPVTASRRTSLVESVDIAPLKTLKWCMHKVIPEMRRL